MVHTACQLLLQGSREGPPLPIRPTLSGLLVALWLYGCIRGIGSARQLEEVFWLEEERLVNADWVVSDRTRLLQRERQSRHYVPAPSRVTVRENQQGELAIAYRGRPLPFTEIAVRPLREVPPPRGSVSPASRGYAAPSDHPWKRSYKEMPTPLQAAV